ncbi:MAG: DUF1365 domain-containing protein [Planctomycetes bacterium]|nr:DUF1365 domain-containing protein [Planctomycetota bacterium]
MSDRVPGPALCIGQVLHRRTAPVGHAFRYPMGFLRLPVTWLDAQAHAPRRRRVPLAVDAAGLFSVWRRDHGARDGSSLEPWIRDLLRQHGLACADGEVTLYTLPRVFGHAFNPVSFWTCRDREGRLRAVLCEVSNTFGERHNYLAARADAGPVGSGEELRARKVFHVSPFFPVDGEYRFRFHETSQRCLFRVDYMRSGSLALVTALSGEARPVAFASMLRAFVRVPWMAAAVLGRIHLHALRLWWKGVPFHRKPAPPAEGTTR